MDVLTLILWLAVGSFLVWGGFWVIGKGVPAPAQVAVKCVFAVLVLVAVLLLLFGQGPIALPTLRLRR